VRAKQAQVILMIAVVRSGTFPRLLAMGYGYHIRQLVQIVIWPLMLLPLNGLGISRQQVCSGQFWTLTIDMQST
jgi:hypothetical protein